jgi:hypothetical protein
MKKLTKILVLVIGLGAVNIAVAAQPNFDATGGDDMNDATAPIPGIAIAALTGLFLGVRKKYVSTPK